MTTVTLTDLNIDKTMTAEAMHRIAGGLSLIGCFPRRPRLPRCCFPRRLPRFCFPRRFPRFPCFPRRFPC